MSILASGAGSQSSQGTFQEILDDAVLNNQRVPSPAVRAAANTLFDTLKSIGALELLDVLYIFGTDGSLKFSIKDWKNPSSNAIYSSKPPFLFTEGFKPNSDGGSNWIDANWSPADGVNYTKDSNGMFIYYKNITNDLSKLDGSRDGDASKSSIIIPSSGVNEVVTWVNSLSSSYNINEDAQFDTADGLYFFGRIDANTQFVRKNNGTRQTSSISSTDRTAFNFTLGGLNNAGSVIAPSDRNVLVFGAGANLGNTIEGQVNTAVQAYITAISTPPETIGTLYNKSSWVNLADFVDVSSGAAVVSNAIQFTGGAGSFNKTLELIGYTALEKWKITARVKLAGINDTGLGFGVKCLSTVPTDLVAQLYFSSSGQVSLKIYVGEIHTDVDTSDTSFTGAINDIVEVVIERDGTQVRVKANNITNPAGEITAVYDYVYTGVVMPATGRLAIFNFGGSHSVTSLKTESKEFKNIELMFIGDSKTTGYRASSLTQRFASLVSEYIGKTVVIAGPGDTIVNTLLRTDEIISINPKKAVLCIGSNDKRFGASDGDIISNYDDLFDVLTTAGINVIHTTGLKEDSLDQSALANHITSTYPSPKVINTLPEDIDRDIDGIHPSNLGNSQTADFLIGTAKLL